MCATHVSTQHTQRKNFNNFRGALNLHDVNIINSLILGAKQLNVQ